MAPRRRKLDEETVTLDVPAAAGQPALPIPDLERHSATAPKRYSVSARNHVSFYLPREMQEAAKIVAIKKRVRANDLYIEGLRRVLMDEGYTADQLG